MNTNNPAETATRYLHSTGRDGYINLFIHLEMAQKETDVAYFRILSKNCLPVSKKVKNSF
jgi:hypothetical protein